MKLLGVTIREIWPILVLLVLVIFVFTAAGMKLFGDSVGVEGTERVSFKYFGTAAIQVIMVLCNEEWGLVYDETIASTGLWAALYFITLIIIGQFLVLNLVLAGIVDGAFELFNHALDNQNATLRLLHVMRKSALYLYFVRFVQQCKKVPAEVLRSQQAYSQKVSGWGIQKVQQPVTGHLASKINTHMHHGALELVRLRERKSINGVVHTKGHVYRTVINSFRDKHRGSSRQNSDATGTAGLGLLADATELSQADGHKFRDMHAKRHGGASRKTEHSANGADSALTGGGRANDVVPLMTKFSATRCVLWRISPRKPQSHTGLPNSPRHRRPALAGAYMRPCGSALSAREHWLMLLSAVLAV